MFGFDFSRVRVDGFLLGLFGEGFEFKDEFEPDFLHVKVVFVRDVAESSLHESECGAACGTPPRFQRIMHIWIQICNISNAQDRSSVKQGTSKQ